MDCPAYVSLSTKARAALIEVTRGYNGSNNGMIVLSVRQLAERMCCDLYTAALALRELVEKGFIEPRIKGAFSIKFKRATECHRLCCPVKSHRRQRRPHRPRRRCNPLCPRLMAQELGIGVLIKLGMRVITGQWR